MTDENLEINLETVETVFNQRSGYAIFVPRILTNVQKLLRFDITTDFPSNSHLLPIDITHDET